MILAPLYLRTSSYLLLTACNSFFWQKLKRESLHVSLVVHQVRAYSGFFSMKRLGASLLLWLPSTHGNLSIEFAGIHLYSRMKRGTVSVNSLDENTTQCPRPGLV